MRPVSQMIDPTALPSARPGWPWMAANTDTAASGAVVPRLTIVAPITTFGIPDRDDSSTASSTSQSAALARTAKLAAITSPSKPE